MKYTLMLDKYNVIYALSPCYEKEYDGRKIFLPSLSLTSSDKEKGASLMIVDAKELPIEKNLDDLFTFFYNERTKKFEINIANRKWRARENLRSLREKELLKTDYLALYEMENEKKQEYLLWKEEWLKATETFIYPKKTVEWIEKIITNNFDQSKIEERNYFIKIIDESIERLKRGIGEEEI